MISDLILVSIVSGRIRLLYESAVRMEYIIHARPKNAVIRSFLLSSYKSESQVIGYLKRLARQRELIKIEKRMQRKIKSRLRRDGITITKLLNNRQWQFDSKSFYDIAKAVGREAEYHFVYSGMSHFIHGDWYEISIHHLVRDGRYYQPDLTYNDPDPRIACPITTIAIDALHEYLRWSKADPYEYVRRLIDLLSELNERVNEAHEATLGE